MWATPTDQAIAVAAALVRLQAQFSTFDGSLRRQIIPNVIGFDDRLKSLRGIIIPIGFNAYAGLVAIGCERSNFPTENDRMLLTVAANHAATAFRSANLIHERSRAEEEVRKARDELEMKVMERTAELQRTMAELAHMNRLATAGVLLASIAHEINQPLTGIVMQAGAARQWLASREPSIEKARDALDQIERDGLRAGEIITSLRGMFKKETQARNPIDINKLIFTVLAIVRHELKKHGVELRTELDESVPSLEGDRVQLQQVVLNLVMNAIEAMQTGTLRILSIRSALAHQILFTWPSRILARVSTHPTTIIFSTRCSRPKSVVWELAFPSAILLSKAITAVFG
jgi:signal transduction histidine kinase